MKKIDYTKFVDMKCPRFKGMSSDSVRATVSDRELTEILFHYYTGEIIKELKPVEKKGIFKKGGK